MQLVFNLNLSHSQNSPWGFYLFTVVLKKEDIHCNCITPGQDLGLALGHMSFRGLTASLLECAKSYQSLNFSSAILSPGQNSIAVS